MGRICNRKGQKIDVGFGKTRAINGLSILQSDTTGAEIYASFIFTYNTTQESSHTIPVEIVKLGLEWILETAVFRFEYFSTKQTFFGSEDAQTITSEDLGVLNSDNNRPQTETIKLQGGLGLVVQGRF